MVHFVLDLHVLLIVARTHSKPFAFKLQLGKLVLGAHVCWLGALAVCSDEDLASDSSVCSAAACSGANSAIAWHDSLSPSLAQQQDKSGADSAELGVQINNVVD